MTVKKTPEEPAKIEVVEGPVLVDNTDQPHKPEAPALEEVVEAPGGVTQVNYL